MPTVRSNPDPDRVITLELVRAVRQRARDAKWRIEHAFERLGCTCGPKRVKLEELEQRLRDEVDAVQKSPLGEQVVRLKGEILEIDLREHRVLDEMGRRAGQFYATWMLERLARGDTNFLGAKSLEAEFEFAQDWLDGWRPTLNKAAVSEKVATVSPDPTASAEA